MNKIAEQIAVDAMMHFIHEHALRFNGPENGVISWSFQNFVDSPNGQKLRRVLESLTDARPTWDQPDVF